MDVALQKATRQHTKLYNNRLVLRAIYDYGAISRAELARLTHLTRATVSEVVADLIRQGLVEEVGHGPAAVGRTPVLLSVIADGRQLIAVDVANGEARGAIVNLRGEIQQRITLSINHRDGAAVVALLYDLIDTLLTQLSRPLLGIGIGTPGLVNPSGGVRQAVNLGWYDVPLQDLVQTRYGLPTHVANDSQLAALAEYTFGVAHPPRNLAVLLVGRGVGAGRGWSGSCPQQPADDVLDAGLGQRQVPQRGAGADRGDRRLLAQRPQRYVLSSTAPTPAGR